LILAWLRLPLIPMHQIMIVRMTTTLLFNI
jgi:hypothetical protein